MLEIEHGERLRERLLASLASRGLLGEGGLTVFGQPAWRDVPPSGTPQGPQALMDASRAQRSVVACAHATPSTGDDACAAWVEAVLGTYGACAGQTASAREIYERDCASSNPAQLKVGMVVAVPRAPYTTAALRHGHAGLYAGDGVVMDCAGPGAGGVRCVPLDLWLSTYGVAAEPRWGWLAGIALG